MKKKTRITKDDLEDLEKFLTDEFNKLNISEKTYEKVLESIRKMKKKLRG